MNIILNNKRKNFKEVNYVKLYELIKNSNYNHNLEGDDFHHSIFYFNKNHNIDSSENRYANFNQLLNLSEDIERTRRVRKRILEYIPNKISQIKTEQNTVDKQSFRLSKNQYKKSKESIKNKMKMYKHQTKEYKREIYKRIRYVYKVYSYLIPSLYVIKRPSYNIVQCKWKFMGIIQKQKLLLKNLL